MINPALGGGKASGDGAALGSNWANTLVFHSLVALVLLAPLPLGAYPQWAWSAMAVACGALLCLWGLLVLAGRLAFNAPPAFLLWSAAALVLCMLWGLLQTTAFLPEDWWHPIWRDASVALETPLRGAVSLDPVAGRDSVLRVAAYAAIFWLAFQCGRDSRRASFALRALAAGFACYAMYGLGVFFSGAESILWFEKTDYADMVTGTFFNPNSFGAHCGIGLLCATTVLLRRFSNGWAVRFGLRERLRFLLVEFLPRNALMLGVWLVLVSALLLSQSRGAAAATALALLALMMLLALRRGLSIRQWLPGMFGALLAGVLLLLLAGQSLDRKLWESGSDFATRAEIYSQTLTAIRERPLLGTGLGSFEAVYRSHRTAEIRPGARMAHNDYLELALELGIPAAALLVSSVLILAVGCARGIWARRRDYEFPAAGVAVCILVGAHSLVDFSLQIPAVAAAFSLVLGVAVAQAQSGGGGESVVTTLSSERVKDSLPATAGFPVRMLDTPIIKSRTVKSRRSHWTPAHYERKLILVHSTVVDGECPP